MNQKLLILCGSPRKKGTSFSFSRTIKMLAKQNGIDADIIHIIDYYDEKKPIEEAVDAIKDSSIIAIIAPLYVDTLPHINIWFLEKLYNEHRRSLSGKKLFCIGQCGFPDVTRMAPMINTCRMFANATGMTFVGGLGYGGGAALDGAYLEDLGKNGERITNGFRLALDAAFEGKSIPPKAQALLTLKLPKCLFGLLVAYLNHSSKKKAKKYGTDVRRKVYLEK